MVCAQLLRSTPSAIVKPKGLFLHHHAIDREQRARIEPINNKYINGITTTFMLTLLAVLGNQEKPPILNRSKDLGAIILNKSQKTHFILGGGGFIAEVG